MDRADSVISRIRATFPIGWVWKRLGLPGRAAKECRSPFRTDKAPSFSIYRSQDGERWHDHAEGVGGDVCDFWARARDIPLPEAIKELAKLLPDDHSMPETTYTTSELPPEEKKIVWPPDIRIPTDMECRGLAMLRGLSPGAFDLAARLGTLFVGEVLGEHSWILTDANRKCAESRRFDGEHYVKRDGSTMKGYCFSGSSKGTPLGLKTNNPDLDRLRKILLVEGMPDYFAGLELAISSDLNFRVATMLGAGIAINPDPNFSGSTIVIVPHNDASGEKSISAWSEQLLKSGAKNVIVQKLPSQYKDLNDLLRDPQIDPEPVLKGFNERFPPIHDPPKT